MSNDDRSSAQTGSQLTLEPWEGSFGPAQGPSAGAPDPAFTTTAELWIYALNQVFGGGRPAQREQTLHVQVSGWISRSSHPTGENNGALRRPHRAL